MIDIETLRTTITDIVANTLSYFPRLLTAILILLVGWIIARVIATLVKRLAIRIGFDAILARTGISEGLKKAEIRRSGDDLLGLLVFWTIFLNFLLIGLESLGLTAAVEPLRNLIGLLPRLLAALATLVAGILIAQFLGRAAQAAMASMGVEFHEQVGSGVNMLLIVMVVIVVLEQLGIDATIMTTIFTNVLTIAVAGAALAFGLGGRDVARNVLAGYYAREQFHTGDRLVIDGEEFTLEGINTLNAELRRGDEQLVIPNTRLTHEAIRLRG